MEIIIYFFILLIWLILGYKYLNPSKKKAHIWLISSFIFIAISGRIPAPFLHETIEIWMIYGVIFFPLSIGIILKKDFIKITSEHIKKLPISASLGIYFTIFISTCLIYSQLFTPKGTFGYVFVGLLIYSLIFYLYLFNYKYNYINISNTIIRYIVSSTFVICLIALIAQSTIFLQFFECNSFSIFHPQDDIHCIPFGISTIYRLSIGSNINEFSFYILLAYILYDQHKIELILPSVIKKIENRELIRFIFLLCGLLSLSRAWVIGILGYYLIKIIISLIRTIAIGNNKNSINTFSINLKKISLVKLILYIVVTTIVISFLYNVYEYALYLLTSRFQFLTDPKIILEGSSSLSRLNILEQSQNLIAKIGFLPIIAPGAGTSFHNSFIQLALEVGLPCSLMGLFLLFLLILKKPMYAIPPLIFLVSHHILYNPIMWLYFWAISNSDINRRKV